jgi:hypothetical protein
MYCIVLQIDKKCLADSNETRNDHRMSDFVGFGMDADMRFFCQRALIGSPLFAPEPLLPVAPFPIAPFSSQFRRTVLIHLRDRPFLMEACLSLIFSNAIQSQSRLYLQIPAKTPAVPIPAPISPTPLHPTWFNPSSNVTQASAVKPSFVASVPALRNPPNNIL